jgi:hypothetical protein
LPVVAVVVGKIQGMMGPVDSAVVKAAEEMPQYQAVLTQVEAVAAAEVAVALAETGVVAALE